MPTGATTFDAWLGALSGYSAFDAVLLAENSGSTTFDANVVKAGWSQFDAYITDARGTFRGTMTTAERDTLEIVQPGDTLINIDSVPGKAYHEFTPDGTTWVQAGHHAAREAGRANLITGPSTGGFRVEIGDPTYPIRYWDGTDARFRLTSTGDIELGDLSGTGYILVKTSGGTTWMEFWGGTATPGTIQQQSGNYMQIQPAHGTFGSDTLPYMRLSPNATASLAYIEMSSVTTLRTGTVELRNADDATLPTSVRGRVYAKTRHSNLIGSPAFRDSAGREHVLGSGVGLERIVADVAIANTETVVLALPPLANYLDAVGTTLRFRASGTLTTGGTPGSGVFRVRVGPTTKTGVIPATLTLAQTASVTAAPFYLEADFTVRTDGATGTILGNMWVGWNGDAPIAFTNTGTSVVSGTTATVTFDGTAANRVELTYISGNSGTTATFRTATLETVTVV